jgi:hypothetical protein
MRVEEERVFYYRRVSSSSGDTAAVNWVKFFEFSDD